MNVGSAASVSVTSVEGAVVVLLRLLEERIRNIVREEVGAHAEAAPSTPDCWMAVNTAAAYLDLTPAALRARVARGEVKAFRLGNDGRSLRFKREDLDAHVVRIEGTRSA